MKWFFPSFQGDFRLEPSTEGCRLLTIKPTPHEIALLTSFVATAVKKKWLKEAVTITADDQCITLAAGMDKVGVALVKSVKPKDRTLTAVTFRDGRVEVAETSNSKALESLAGKMQAYGGEKTPAAVAAPPDAAPKPEPAKAAVSVARPTPCCPQCVPGSVGPASEVLLSFLTPEQHEQWAKERAIIVTGGQSGNRYLINHRHSARAQKLGRITWDMDDSCVVHFHDNSVPPEEEVLAAKLILEHREPWLRNEATMFNNGYMRFKNPFGDVNDGVVDAALTQTLGNLGSLVAAFRGN